MILTAGFGEGHNAAACLATWPPPSEARPHPGGGSGVFDVFALAPSPRLNSVSRRGYLALINRAPRLWQSVYGWLDRSTFSGRARVGCSGASRSRPGSRRLRLRARRPTAIVSTRIPFTPICSTAPGRGGTARPSPFQPRDRFDQHQLDLVARALRRLVRAQSRFGPHPGERRDRARPHPRLRLPHPGSFIDRHRHLAPPDLAASGRPRVLCIINSVTRNAPSSWSPR